MKRSILVAALLCGAVAFGQQAQTTKGGGDGKTHAQWWGHAAFVITTPGGANIAIDPWFKNPKAPKDAAMPTNLDAILLTHGHFDHVGQTMDLLKSNPNAKVIGAFELVSAITGGKDMGANPGGTVTVKDAKIHLVEAVHSSGYSPDGKTTTYGGNPIGFVIEIEKGPTLYHAGDTDTFSSMALIGQRYHPTIAMLPIGGQFTMDPTGAALAAQLLKVKTVVPIHFGTFPALTGTPAELTSALKKTKVSAKVMELKIGETATLQ